jgi:hypothetical protein
MIFFVLDEVCVIGLFYPNIRWLLVYGCRSLSNFIVLLGCI